jgi:hypothetical protein
MKLADQVQKAQIKNILAKLKAGKTISKREQAAVEAYDRGQEPPKTMRELADHYNVSHVAVIKWGKAGAPIHGTIEEIDAWRASKVKEAPDNITNAKLRKTLLEVEKLEIANSRARGDLIPRDAVRDRVITAGGILVAQLQAMANDMPGQLAGATESQVRDRLEARHSIVIDRFREALTKAWEDIGGE